MDHDKETAEMEPTELKFLTLSHAEGSIEAGPEQQRRLNEVTERLQRGEFHGKADATIPVICIDGRLLGFHMLPNAAGGSETIFVADDLINKKYAGEDGTTVSGYRNVLARIIATGNQVGGHDDDHDHQNDGKCGCGANDKLPDIYGFIAQKGDIIRGVSGKLAVEVSDALHDKIVGNAAARTSFSSGPEMLAELESQEGEVIVEHLGGEHKEVIIVVNTVEGTTLDREKLAAEFGEDYEAFNVDVWAFENAARLLTDDETEVAELTTAMVYYNLATAHILTGKNMRVITR